MRYLKSLVSVPKSTGLGMGGGVSVTRKASRCGREDYEKGCLDTSVFNLDRGSVIRGLDREATLKSCSSQAWSDLSLY